MVDVFTLLLVFLLASFSTDDPVRPSDRGFALPRSTSEKAVPQGHAVDLTQQSIFLDDKRVASSEFYARHEESLVQELYWPLLKMEKGPLLIRSDADMPYAIVQKLIFTAHEAGWHEIALVAQSKKSL
jgi:biopolymer transport protein ExbD